jgi:DNA-binding transcriptional LysR family regulator
VSGRLSANNGDALRSAALEAHGMLLQPLFIVEDDLRSGALVEVLLDRFSPGELTVFAVYARSRQRSAKVGAFVELVTSSLSTPES